MSPEINTARNERNTSLSAGDGGSCKIDRNSVGTHDMMVIRLSCTHSMNFRALITVVRSAMQTRAPQSNGTNNSLSEKSNDNGAAWLNRSAWFSQAAPL